MLRTVWTAYFMQTKHRNEAQLKINSEIRPPALQILAASISFTTGFLNLDVRTSHRVISIWMPSLCEVWCRRCEQYQSETYLVFRSSQLWSSASMEESMTKLNQGNHRVHWNSEQVHGNFVLHAHPCQVGTLWSESIEIKFEECESISIIQYWVKPLIVIDQVRFLKICGHYLLSIYGPFP